MITAYEDAEKYIGRKADKNRKIYNGMMKTYFYQFLGPRPSETETRGERLIKKLEGILRLAILCLGVYLVYTLYRPQADRLIREVKEQVFTTTENPAALLTEERQEETEAQKTLSFPARYDSRDYGRAPDVRNQGSLGTCWAVAAVSALEASLLPEEHLRFSADHLSLQNGYAKSQDDGGAYTMTMAYLTAWTGTRAGGGRSLRGRLLAGRS